MEIRIFMLIKNIINKFNFLKKYIKIKYIIKNGE